MILDKLIEKKDLLIYITMRMKELSHRKQDVIESATPRERQALAERFNGRLKELQLLKKAIVQSTLKKEAKHYWDKWIKWEYEE